MCGCVSIELVGWKLSSVCFVLQFARSVNILSLFWCRQVQESSRLALLVGQETIGAADIFREYFEWLLYAQPFFCRRPEPPDLAGRSVQSAALMHSGRRLPPFCCAQTRWILRCTYMRRMVYFGAGHAV